MTAATPGQAAHQAETVAIAFHQAYEELAPQYGYRTREASAKPWDEVPAKNAALMVATAARLLETGVISVAAQEPHAADGVWTVAECLERIGDLAGALHEIKTAYTPGTYAHDLAHATLDQSGPAPQPAPELAAARAALARVLSWFAGNGTRREASATRAQLAHAYQDGGLTVPEELRRFL